MTDPPLGLTHYRPVAQTSLPNSSAGLIGAGVVWQLQQRVTASVRLLTGGWDVRTAGMPWL